MNGTQTEKKEKEGNRTESPAEDKVSSGGEDKSACGCCSKNKRQ